MRRKEIHVSCSDKGKGVVVMPLTMYEEVTRGHTCKDREIDWVELKRIQWEVTAHARCLARVFNLGGEEGPRNKVRCHDNITTWAQHPPVLRSMAKTHKPPNPDGTPKTRPVVGASSGLGTGLGELLSDLVRPVSQARGSQSECQSTEEMVSRIEEANQRLQDEQVQDLMVGSLDVVALYPSIDQKVGARIVAEEMLRNGVRYRGVDIHKAVRYLAATMTDERIAKEGLTGLMPKRVAAGRQGRRPTVRTKELGGPIPRKERKEAAAAATEGDLGEIDPEGIGGVIHQLDEIEADGVGESRWQDIGRDYTKG